MCKYKNDRNIPIYCKWALPLPDIRCSLEKTDILLLLTLAYNKDTISGSIDIIHELADWLELTDNVVRNKIIVIKKDLMNIQNCCYAIYWQQDKLLPLDRFHWLKPLAGLFHLQLNLISILFKKFWGITGDLVSLN